MTSDGHVEKPKSQLDPWNAETTKWEDVTCQNGHWGIQVGFGNGT